MKKKCLAILLTAILVTAMMATGCSGASDKETDSGEATAETETAVSAEDDQQSEAEETEEKDVEVTEDSDAVTSVEKEEITEPKLTGSITDEDFSELCESIKKSITDEYLQPNNISTEEFVWPSADSQSWEYLSDISGFRMPTTIEEFDSKCEELELYSESSLENKLMQTTMHGIINWINEKGGCDAEFYGTLIMRFAPSFYETLSEEITF